LVDPGGIRIESRHQPCFPRHPRSMYKRDNRRSSRVPLSAMR
jgi:hypothetical protein